MALDPGTIIEVCLALHMRRAARRISRHFDAALAPHRLDISQLNLLCVIAALDEAPLPAVAAFLDVDRSTLSRTLKPLRTLGLVQVRGGRGRSGLVLSLSVRGLDAYTAATGAWKAAQSEIAMALGEARVGRTLETLEQLARI